MSLNDNSGNAPSARSGECSPTLPEGYGDNAPKLPPIGDVFRPWKWDSSDETVVMYSDDNNG